MPRKKKAVAPEPAADTSFNPAEFDPAAQAATIVQDVAAGMGMPDAEREAAHENGHAARHAPRRQDGQSHADAVGRKPGYSPAGSSDLLAGVRLREHQNPYLSVIRFDERPADAVIQLMQDSGFRWRSENKEWTRPIHFDTRQQDRLHAERTFEEACRMVREAKGITHSYGGAA
jgi:hypothetical protein